MSTESVIASVVVLGLAALLRSSFGFGDALLAMPVLTLVLGVGRAVPLVGLVSVLITGGIITKSWRSIDVWSVKRLLGGAVFGVPVGILLLKQAPEEILTRGLGIVVIGFGLYRLLRSSPPQLGSSGWALPFGFVSGCLGGAYNIGGPPVVVYGAMRGWSPDRFRATLQGYFLVSSLVIVAAHGIGGLWTVEVWALFMLSIPTVVAGVLVGRVVHGRLDAALFDRLLSLLLIALGVLVLA